VPIAQAFAGKSTTASFLLDLMANTSVRDILFGLFGVTGTAYGIGTSHVYRKRITALSTQIKHLENQHDPGRSSSGLTSSEDGPTL
jgi:hypothetical protein